MVDNHSTDGSKAYLAERFPEVRFIWNDVNEGFARANNAGIRASTGQYVLMINPDTLLPENIFDQCLSFIQSHPECGALGVRMIDGSGYFLPESKRNIPGWKNSFFKLSGISRIFPNSRFFSGYYAQHIEEREVSQVEILSGAFMMIKRTVLYDVGGWDEDFFMYGEDIDLSYRLVNAGYFNYYLGNTTILHFKGESTQRISRNFIHHFYGSMSLFVRKHYKGLKAFCLHLGILMGRVLAQLQLAFQKTRMPLPDLCDSMMLHLFPGHSAFTEKILTEHKIRFQVTNHWPREERNVLLVQGNISFKEIIHYLDSTAGERNVWITSEESLSIVGSGYRHQRGQVIALSGDAPVTIV